MRTKQNKQTGLGKAPSVKPHESNEDFRARLRAMIPKPPKNAEERPCVRSRNDRGYGYPAGANPDPTKPLESTEDAEYWRKRTDEYSLQLARTHNHADKLTEALRDLLNNPSPETAVKAEDAIMQWEFRDRTDRDS